MPRCPTHAAVRFFSRSCWLIMLIVITLPAAAAPNGETFATPEQLYQLALEARTARDYGAMLDYLRRSAGAGDRAARELLASVLLMGPALYGKSVRADYCEAAYWMRLSATQNSTVGRHQLLLLNSMRDLPGGRKTCKPVPDRQ
jgi:TPR repeat protein